MMGNIAFVISKLYLAVLNVIAYGLLNAFGKYIAMVYFENLKTDTDKNMVDIFYITNENHTLQHRKLED